MLLSFLNPPILELPLAIILLLLIITIPLIVIYLFLRLTEAAFEQIGFDHWHATLAVFGSFIGSLIDIPLSTGTISSYPGWYITLASTIAPGFPTDFPSLLFSYKHGRSNSASYYICPPHFDSQSISFQGRNRDSGCSINNLFFGTACGRRGNSSSFLVVSIISGNLRSSLITRLLWCTINCIYQRLDGNSLGCRYYEYSNSRSASCSLPVGLQTSKPLVLSIGGAGVFDGIFLTGILAVLFAAGIVRFLHGSCEVVKMHRDIQK